VFDPGSNPNIDRVGSAYYDTVHKVRGACAHARDVMAGTACRPLGGSCVNCREYMQSGL
jgi:hypothetical protein